MCDLLEGEPTHLWGSSANCRGQWVKASRQMVPALTTLSHSSTNHLGGSRELLCSGDMKQRALLCSLWLLKATVSLSCTSYLELSWQTTFLCLPPWVAMLRALCALWHQIPPMGVAWSWEFMNCAASAIVCSISSLVSESHTFSGKVSFLSR